MSLTLTPEEISELTGGAQLPRVQVRILQKRGFVRARLERGKAVLERAHYEAVCRGGYTLPAPTIAGNDGARDTARPQLRRIK